jgi:all-trans-retinol dehydrogenase (NAD+)
MHNGWLPREGFTSDIILKTIGKTALNPILILPLILLARFTKKGEDLSIIHPTAFSRIKTLFYLGIVRWLNNYY